MLEDIELKNFPKDSGVYWIKDVDGIIIYVGSSSDLYRRMKFHRYCIKNDGDHNGTSKQDFYRFLQSNQFSVEFQIVNNYRQLEQELLEKHNPRFNSRRAYTSCGIYRGREKEYNKEYRGSYGDKKRQSDKQYYNQKCNYNGKIITLSALSKRLQKQGIPHPVLEAKKYLVS